MATVQFSPDAVERNIPGITDAEEYLSLHQPTLLSDIRRRAQLFQRPWAASLGELPAMAFQACVICIARVLARHGSMAGDHYDYHDELHALELIDHLKALYHSSEAQDLSAAEWIYLAIFATAHDLRQKETGYGPDGVGNNERASADETDRILAAVGFDPEYQQSVYQLLRWMIHGTTFFPTGVELEQTTVGPGALAPVIAERIVEKGHAVGELSATRAAQLVLLASDIDTANVAGSIDQFAERAARMCRELHKLQGHAFLGPHTAPSVLDFLTRGQHQYFFVMQRFNSSMAKAAFDARKAETGKCLKQLIHWLREQYEPLLDHASETLTGEKIVNSFIDKAEQLANPVRIPE